MKKSDEKILMNELHATFSPISGRKWLTDHSCDICGKKGTTEQMFKYNSHYMCKQCQKWYELLPGVVFNSFCKFIKGNVR